MSSVFFQFALRLRRDWLRVQERRRQRDQAALGDETQPREPDGQEDPVSLLRHPDCPERAPETFRQTS